MTIATWGHRVIKGGMLYWLMIFTKARWTLAIKQHFKLSYLDANMSAEPWTWEIVTPWSEEDVCGNWVSSAVMVSPRGAGTLATCIGGPFAQSALNHVKQGKGKRHIVTLTDASVWWTYAREKRVGGTQQALLDLPRSVCHIGTSPANPNDMLGLVRCPERRMLCTQASLAPVVEALQRALWRVGLQWFLAECRVPGHMGVRVDVGGRSLQLQKCLRVVEGTHLCTQGTVQMGLYIDMEDHDRDVCLCLDVTWDC